MKVIRLIRTTVIEYTPNPASYPEGMTIEQMAEFDAKQEDREIIFDECITDEVKYEILDQPNDRLHQVVEEEVLTGIITHQAGFCALVQLITNANPLLFDTIDVALGVVQRQLDKIEEPGKYKALFINGELCIKEQT